MTERIYKPCPSKCATAEDYYKKLARYYQVKYNNITDVLLVQGDLRVDKETGELVWVSDGESV